MIRQAILDRLAELGETKYWLSKQVTRTSVSALYAFLRDDGKLSDYRVEEILEVLDLVIVPAPRVKPAKKSPPRKRRK